MWQIVIRSLIISLCIPVASYFFADFISSDAEFAQYCKSESGLQDIECADLQDVPEGTIENLKMSINFVSFFIEFSLIFIGCFIYGCWALLRPIQKRAELPSIN